MVSFKNEVIIISLEGKVIEVSVPLGMILSSYIAIALKILIIIILIKLLKNQYKERRIYIYL